MDTIVALTTGSAVIAVWSVVLARSFVARDRRYVRRWLAFALFVTALGTGLAGVGYGLGLGIGPLTSFAASVGRGALLTAGIVFLADWRPRA